jgi:molybdenum cofactor cytidylyltransferase
MVLDGNSTAADLVWTILLAAGSSTRFGGSKLLVSHAGKPLVRIAAEAAQAATPNRVLLVTGHNAAAVAAACDQVADRVVDNPHFERGIGSSIACGVRALDPDATGVIIALADQVLVDASHLRMLLCAWSGAGNHNVGSRFRGIVGPPALFGRDAMALLAALNGDQGAQAILRRPGFSLSEVAFEAAAHDIDTPADLEALMEKGL